MLKNNNYLGDVTSADITVRADISYVPNIRSWQRIDGYRAKESEEDTENCLKMLHIDGSAVRKAVARCLLWIRSAEKSQYCMDQEALVILQTFSDSQYLNAGYQLLNGRDIPADIMVSSSERCLLCISLIRSLL